MGTDRHTKGWHSFIVNTDNEIIRIRSYRLLNPVHHILQVDVATVATDRLSFQDVRQLLFDLGGEDECENGADKFQ